MNFVNFFIIYWLDYYLFYLCQVILCEHGLLMYMEFVRLSFRVSCLGLFIRYISPLIHGLFLICKFLLPAMPILFIKVRL